MAEAAERDKGRWLLLLVPILIAGAIAAGWYFMTSESFPFFGRSGTDVQEASTVRALQDQVADLEQQLALADEENLRLSEQVEALNQQLTGQTRTQSEQQQLSEMQSARDRLYATAKQYEEMSASRAVPILQQMPPEEALLILKAMAEKERGRILSKMPPQRAARDTLYLQATPELTAENLTTVQTQLQQLVNQPVAPVEESPFTAEDMARTLSAMPPEAAAPIVERWWNENAGMAATILREMDSSMRASILAAMGETAAAEIAQGLIE